MENFLETYNLRQNQEEIESLNRSVNRKETESLNSVKTIVNTICMKIVERVSSKISHHKEIFHYLLLNLHEIMDTIQTSVIITSWYL